VRSCTRSFDLRRVNALAYTLKPRPELVQDLELQQIKLRSRWLNSFPIRTRWGHKGLTDRKRTTGDARSKTTLLRPSQFVGASQGCLPSRFKPFLILQDHFRSYVSTHHNSIPAQAAIITSGSPCGTRRLPLDRETSPLESSYPSRVSLHVNSRQVS
jgi:hypothetical protein